MPADGEWRFLDMITMFIRHEYHALKKNECFRSSYANGFMICGLGYLAGYVYTNNAKKALYKFGFPAFILSTLITGVVCNMNKAKGLKGGGAG